MRLHPIHWIYAVLALGSILYVTVIRPWQFRWGATDDEVQRALPGDHLVPNSTYHSTRAITINAPREDVWPWLLQLGQGRGGFYSHDWLENLIGLNIHSVDRIVPELQRLKEGDFVAAEPNHQFGWVVSALDAPDAILLRVGSPHAGPAERGPYFDGGIAGVWNFVLEPIGEHATRLIVGYRADWEPSFAAWLFNVLLIEPGHFIMERGMMRGIKHRAERFSTEHQAGKIAA